MLRITPNNQDDIPELAESLEEFVQYRLEHLTGDEKGEAQVFLDRLFRAYGHSGVREAGATLESRIRRGPNHTVSFADLMWKPRCLIEMKRAGVDLRRHYQQAFEYWIHAVPDRPNYVVLCDFDNFWIYDFDHQLDEPVTRVALTDLPRRWEAMAFLLPTPIEPLFDNDLVQVTKGSADLMARVFRSLVDRGVDRSAAQRFTLQCVMAAFSEDVGLLPAHSFTRAVEDSLHNRGSAWDLIFGLFQEMNRPGTTSAGRYQGTPYFNGGLFEAIEPIELKVVELTALELALTEDWSAVRPEIFGTLFEQSMHADERHAFGAHYTNPVDIAKVIQPTIVRPWRSALEEARETSIQALEALLDSLHQYTVLDPACGAGNFLYIAYRELRRIEAEIHEAIANRRRGGLRDQRPLSFLSPRQFYGIDIKPFAVDLAKVTLLLAQKLSVDELGTLEQILPLTNLDENIVAKDALFVAWPQANAIIGNPPYLGRRRLVEERGAAYADQVDSTFPDVGGVSDYVVYWFRRAHDRLPAGGRAGLVGTNTVRQGSTRKASLDYITDHGGTIYEAVSTQPWSGDASVAVSIVNWAKDLDVSPKYLWIQNGGTRLEVESIAGSLSPHIDLRQAQVLRVNTHPKRCFQGQTPGHTSGFVLSQSEADALMASDPKAHSVLHPYLIGRELSAAAQPSRFIIDFSQDDPNDARAASHGAFERVWRLVLPDREAKAAVERERNEAAVSRHPRARVNWHHRSFLERWWKLSYRREDMLEALEGLNRYIALSRVAVAHRQSVYVFMPTHVWPGDALQVFAFDDDYSLGVLHSSIHRQWFEERCSTMRVDLRYTASTVFDSFPWPQLPGSSNVAAVNDAVGALLEYREALLRAGTSYGEQYNGLEDPGRNPLRTLHEELDDAVMNCYGFDRSEDVLAQLLALNQAVSSEEVLGSTDPQGPGPIITAGSS